MSYHPDVGTDSNCISACLATLLFVVFCSGSLFTERVSFSTSAELGPPATCFHSDVSLVQRKDVLI